MQTTPITRINVSDKKFCISYPLEDGILLASIKRIGIIQPLILLAPPPYTIVTGFKRIEAALHLGLTDIPCIMVNITEKDALLRSIHDNMGRALNIIEKANCIEKMLHMAFSTEEVYDVMTLLSLSRHEKIAGRLRDIAGSDETMKCFILKKDLSMQNIETLLRFTSEEKEHIIEILTPLHTTESTIREILQMLHLIKVRKGAIDFSTIIGADDIYGLKARLKTLTYPILSSLEKGLKDIKIKCALPPNIDIKVDPFFEKEYIDILIRAKNPDEIRVALLKLNGVFDAGYIRSIFGLAKD
ncbi:MAG: ParB/RepB/Spo0J family partition protein [Proteobacteria bacterium]|nr:ParB/RepB/Spo0J family partition protein [Pseudomonadota bacterium]